MEAPGAPAERIVAEAVQGTSPASNPSLDEPAFDEFVDAVRAEVPSATARGLAMGLPSDVVTASLADIERKIAVYGDDGIRDWLVMVLRFDVVQLGRLQFERATSEHGHAIHIPETGPLTPGAVDESLRLAARWFGSAAYSCESWMLDPALHALPDASNVRAFADRFTLVDEPAQAPRDGDGATSGDRAVCKFVFNLPYRDVLSLDRNAPGRSSVQRLVLQRLVSGYHWTEALGTLMVDA